MYLYGGASEYSYIKLNLLIISTINSWNHPEELTFTELRISPNKMIILIIKIITTRLICLFN